MIHTKYHFPHFYHLTIFITVSPTLSYKLWMQPSICSGPTVLRLPSNNSLAGRNLPKVSGARPKMLSEKSSPSRWVQFEYYILIIQSSCCYNCPISGLLSWAHFTLMTQFIVHLYESSASRPTSFCVVPFSSHPVYRPSLCYPLHLSWHKFPLLEVFSNCRISLFKKIKLQKPK